MPPGLGTRRGLPGLVLPQPVQCGVHLLLLPQSFEFLARLVGVGMQRRKFLRTLRHLRLKVGNLLPQNLNGRFLRVVAARRRGG